MAAPLILIQTARVALSVERVAGAIAESGNAVTGIGLSGRLGATRFFTGVAYRNSFSLVGEDSIRFGFKYGNINTQLGKRYVIAPFEFSRRSNLTKHYRDFVINGKHGKGGILDLSKRLAGNLNNVANSVKADFTVDTTSFDSAMKDYVRFTRRTAKEIVNQKAFSISLNAYKYTYKADKETIVSQLSEPARVGNGLRVADILAITKLRKQGKRKQGKRVPKNVEEQGNKLIRGRKSKSGSLQRTWLPAINQMAPAVKRSPKKGLPYGDGYGRPERRETDLAQAVLASVLKINSGKVNGYMVAGFQKAFDEEARSMREYVQKKVDKLVNNFNNSK